MNWLLFLLSALLTLSRSSTRATVGDALLAGVGVLGMLSAVIVQRGGL